MPAMAESAALRPRPEASEVTRSARPDDSAACVPTSAMTVFISPRDWTVFSDSTERFPTLADISRIEETIFSTEEAAAEAVVEKEFTLSATFVVNSDIWTMAAYVSCEDADRLSVPSETAIRETSIALRLAATSATASR